MRQMTAPSARLAHDLLQAQLDRARLRGLREALRHRNTPVLIEPPHDASEAQIENYGELR